MVVVVARTALRIINMNIKDLSKKEKLIYKAKHPLEYKAYLSELRRSNGRKGGVAKKDSNYLRNIK